MGACRSARQAGGLPGLPEAHALETRADPIPLFARRAAGAVDLNGGGVEHLPVRPGPLGCREGTQLGPEQATQGLEPGPAAGVRRAAALGRRRRTVRRSSGGQQPIRLLSAFHLDGGAAEEVFEGLAALRGRHGDEQATKHVGGGVEVGRAWRTWIEILGYLSAILDRFFAFLSDECRCPRGAARRWAPRRT